MNIVSFGFGSIAQRHVQNIASERRLQRLRVVNSRLDGGVEIRPGFNIECKDIGSMRNEKEIDRELSKLDSNDLIIVASPSSMHVEHISKAIKVISNKTSESRPKVLIEKPICTNKSQIEMLKKINKEDISSRIVVVSQLRAHPLYGYIRNIITSKKYGALEHVSIDTHEHISLWHTWENYRDSYATRNDLGGGCFLTQMHDLEIMTSITGIPKESIVVKGDGSGLGIDCDDYYSCIFRQFPNGWPKVATVNTSYYCKVPTRIHNYFFETAYIRLDFINNSYEVIEKENRKTVQFHYERNNMYIDLVNNLLKNNEQENISGLVSYHESMMFYEWLIDVGSCG